MVAGPNHYRYAVTRSITHFRRQLGRSTFYLFFILMKWQAKHTSLAVIAIGFTLFYLVFKKEWLLTPVGVCFVGFLIGPVGDFTHIIWMQLAKLLGFINSRILLSIIFFLILTPIALLMRLLGKTQFIKNEGTQQSLFVSRNQLYNRQDLEQPF